MIWKLLIWQAFILAHAIRDWYHIAKLSKKPDYLQSNVARVSIAAAYVFLLFDYRDFELVIDLIIYMAGTFWLLFPLILNKLRGREPFYLGKSSGWLDPHFIKHPVQFRLALLGALILSILAVVVILQR